MTDRELVLERIELALALQRYLKWFIPDGKDLPLIDYSVGDYEEGRYE